MPKTYSTYEAKARLSEILDRVRDGDVVTITHRGTPVAEVRPVERSEGALEARIDQLRRAGVITEAKSAGTWRPIRRKRGALRRFLESRD